MKQWKVLPFLLPSVVWLFSIWACSAPMPLFSACETVVCCLSFMPRFPRLAGLWMLRIRIGPVLERMLSVATICWRVIMLEFGIPKLLPYSLILEGRWGFENAWFQFFCIFSFSVLLFLLVVFSYSHLNHSQLAPFPILLQLPSPLLLHPQS